MVAPRRDQNINSYVLTYYLIKLLTCVFTYLRTYLRTYQINAASVIKNKCLKRQKHGIAKKRKKQPKIPMLSIKVGVRDFVDPKTFNIWGSPAHNSAASNKISIHRKNLVSVAAEGVK